MSAEKEVNLGLLTQIPPGEGRVFAVGDLRVAVFHDRGGKVYAADPVCPHAGGPLADGLVGQGTVVCPLHERIYDLATGESTNSECQIKVYSVSLGDDDAILLKV